jgi:hypothetical protein
VAEVRVQRDSTVGISVAECDGQGPDPDADPGLLRHLPDERGRVILSGADPPSRKLPRPGERRISDPRLDEHTAPLVDDRSQHDLLDFPLFGHREDTTSDPEIFQGRRVLTR